MVLRLPLVPRGQAGDLRALWRDSAECAQELTEAEARGFTSDKEGTDRTAAKRKCWTTCPVRLDCLADALADEKSEGVRGGYHFNLGGLSEPDRASIKLIHRKPSRKIPTTGSVGSKVPVKEG